MSRLVARSKRGQNDAEQRGPRDSDESSNRRVAIVRRLVGLLRPEVSRLLLATFLSVLAAMSGLAALYQLRPIVNHYEAVLRYFPHPGGHLTDPLVAKELAGANRCVLLFLGFSLSYSLNAWLQARLLVRISTELVGKLRRRLFETIHRLPIRFFDRTPHGELMSRVVSDVENVGMALGSALPQLLVSVITAVGTLGVMIHIEWRLALVSMLVVPVIGWVSRGIARRTRDGHRRQQDRLGELNALIGETLTGQQVVRLFEAEARFVERFDRANQDFHDAAKQAQFYGRILGPINNMFGNLGYAVTALVGVWLVARHDFDLGGVAACLSYGMSFILPISDIAAQGNNLMSSVASAERVFRTLDEPDDSPIDGDLEFPVGATQVVLNQICFAYVPDEPVLDNVSLVVEPGKMLALVGPTGAGKTTIASLLTRFYELDSGTIQIGGVDLRRINKQSLRAQVAVVLQEPRFFSLSIRENIRFGRLDASDAEVEEAAIAAEADSFIRDLPDGYDTVLAEDAGNISRGQCQLLAIARAFVANPRLLVLDEATSNVDPRTDLHIQSAVRRLMRGRTSFVIAHRLSTIRDADAIAVLDRGRLVELGNHSTLLAQGGLYATLCQIQEDDVELDGECLRSAG